MSVSGTVYTTVYMGSEESRSDQAQMIWQVHCYGTSAPRHQTTTAEMSTPHRDVQQYPVPELEQSCAAWKCDQQSPKSPEVVASGPAQGGLVSLLQPKV